MFTSIISGMSPASSKKFFSVATSPQLLSSTYIKITGFSLLLGFALRSILLLNQQTEASFGFADTISIFSLGAINDLCISTVAFFFMWLDIVFISDSKYRSPWGYITFGIILALLAYVTFFNTIFDEYGSVVPSIVQGLLLYKAVSFGIRLFVPKVRKRWSQAIYYITFFTYASLILFNGLAEYFFWDEFGVRYNFIAVDYLVYTNEVIGNIMESYPIVPLFSVLFLLSGVITFLFVRKSNKLFSSYPSSRTKAIASAVYVVCIIAACFILKFNVRFQNNENVYVNELRANGIYKFYNAFMNSHLDYDKFYLMLSEEEAATIIHNEYSSDGKNNLHAITDSLPELRKNIVLVVVESMSASFLEHYGNTEGITPNLDRLMDESLAFTNLYATGNRTVRGLEAVTLSLPPCAGESIVKQPNNANLFSTAKILKGKGYTVQYLYGGDSYFDNMATFFGGNGYDIIDKKTFAKDEITFSNIWGVCDEDMYSKAISVFNENAESGKPFFAHITTVSNHRPFTYPEGKIDIPATSKSRSGGVKYTDYAIGRFIEEAKQQPWFSNTVFIFVADHCASSAGKTELPLNKYHIPAFIYSPDFIQPQKVEQLASQIDIMPTVFSLLHFSYESQFYGKNILADNYSPRAFVATYQSLGYLQNDILTILSPVKRVEQYSITKDENGELIQTVLNNTDSVMLKNAIASYQTSARKLSN